MIPATGSVRAPTWPRLHVGFAKVLTLMEFAFFPDVEAFDRPEVAHDPSPHFGDLIAVRAVGVFPGNIAVFWADRERWGDGDVGQVEVFQGAAHELGAGLTVGHGRPHVQVEDRATGVFALQLFLVFEGGEGVWGVGDRQLGGVGVVGFPLGSGVDDVGESFAANR